MSDIRQEIEQLRDDIRRHDHLYYVDAASTISDLAYDRLLTRLRDLEQQHPEWIRPDSPTQRIGDAPLPELQQVEHRVPMLSIDNTYSLDEVRSYFSRTEKLLENEPIQWDVELKIDGVAAAVIYEKGVLTRGLTRGNGRVGDDITHNIRTIGDVPLRLLGEDVPALLEVRGEVYMTNPDLAAVNQRQQAEGKPLYANPRNSVAGAIRRLDPRLCAKMPLRMFCHGIGQSEGLKEKKHLDLINRLKDWGLTPTPGLRRCDGGEAVIDYCETMIEQLHELDFEVDGIVIKVDQFSQRDKLGATSKSPRWVIAYKFEKYEAISRINEIRVQVGKTGTITPVAELEPIQLAGTTVSRASLHNADEIERKDIRQGDVVVVEKAGKIIPHIVRVETHERKSELPPFAFPTTCPSCDTSLVRDEGGVYIRCTNPTCPAQVKERLSYYASRNAMDIEGLGEKLVDQLVESGLATTCADLYDLKTEQVSALDRMADKSADKLITAIAKSKQRGLACLLNALSIRHVGRRVADILAHQFASIDSLQQADIETLSTTEEIGPIIATSVYEFLQSDFGRHTIERLTEHGVGMELIRSAAESDSLEGKTLVVTGKLLKFTRETIHELIRQHGGQTATSISSKTDYLIAGEKAGSKLAKAEKLGITVINEDELEKLVSEKA